MARHLRHDRQSPLYGRLGWPPQHELELAMLNAVLSDRDASFSIEVRVAPNSQFKYCYIEIGALNFERLTISYEPARVHKICATLGLVERRSDSVIASVLGFSLVSTLMQDILETAAK